MFQATRVTSWIGIGLSMLSVVSLAYQGFRLGWATPLHTLVTDYDTVARLFVTYLGISHVVHGIANFIRERLIADLQLQPHWKHIFILTSIYFGGDVWTYWKRSRVFSAVFTFVFGMAISIISSIGFSATIVDENSLIPALWPLSGFVVYETVEAVLCAFFQRPAGKSRRSAFVHYFATYALTTAFVGAISLIVGLVLLQHGLSPAGLILMFVFLIGLAMRNLAVGAWLSSSNKSAWYDPLHPNLTDMPEPQQTWTSRAARSATTVLGMRIVLVFLGAALFIIGDAGLDFLRSHTLQ